MDDLQDILLENEEYLKENFYQLLREHKFIFLSRAYMPAWMKPYQIIGQMGIMDVEALRFGEKEIKKYMESYQVEVDLAYLYEIRKVTLGYPLAITFIAYWFAAGEIKLPDMVNKVYKDIFDYYDEMLFQNWSRELYQFMLQMGGFESFTLKLATLVTGYPQIREIVDEAERVGSFMKQKNDEFVIEPFFQKYLQYKQRQQFSEAMIHNICHNAGLYYELESDMKNALKYYSMCKDTTKINELLARNSDMHPGIASYLEVEEYYLALSEEQILQSPVLMSGMCMLCSLKMQVEESEYWYEKLKEYGQKLKKTDVQYKYVLGKLSWLDLSLPHRGSVGVEKILVDMMRKKQNKEIAVREISITSNLPSVLNGGKDFSCWFTKADMIYAMLKPVFGVLLGKGGQNLADFGMAEKMLETADKDTYKIMTLLNKGIDEAAAQGQIEMQFAGIGIMYRLYMAQGNTESSYNMLKDFQKQAEAKQQTQILPNLQAVLTNYQLRIGKNEKADIWMKENAPNENEGFIILERYRYMTKARCYISQQKYMEAISLLNRLIQYSIRYDRTMFRVQARILLAIILYRTKDESWKEVIKEALLEAQQYQFIQMIAEEGAAVLPLLQECDVALDKDYTKKLLQHTKEEALLYPSYLKENTVIGTDSLTATEKQVLMLLGRGMKNKEIGEFLNISLNTVAYHTKNIYQKLGVNNRTQATNIAKTIFEEGTL